MASLANIIMSVPALKRTVNGKQLEFTSNDKLILLAILYCQKNGIKTSYSNLAKSALCSVTTVVRCLNNLISMGFIRKHNHVRDYCDGKDANSYDLTIDHVPGLIEAERRQARMLKGQCAEHGRWLEGYGHLPDGTSYIYCPEPGCRLQYESDSPDGERTAAVSLLDGPTIQASE